jgi:hypothetical protein
MIQRIIVCEFYTPIQKKNKDIQKKDFYRLVVLAILQFAECPVARSYVVHA